MLDINTWHKSRHEVDCSCSIQTCSKNLKGSKGIWFEFAFEDEVVIKDF